MNYSASNLVKQSASQIAYMALKKIKHEATPRQFRGNSYASQVVKKEVASEEKRGIISLGDDLLFFTIDMVRPPLLVEIKMVEGEPEPWYLEQSVLQSALYAALAGKVTQLDTPIFKKKEGYKQEIIDRPENFIYQLWFGEDKYEVQPSEELYKHYLLKMQVINKTIANKDFAPVRAFDAKFKHKEFGIFKPKFSAVGVMV